MAKKKFSIKTNQTSKAQLMAASEQMRKYVRQSVERHLMDMHSTIKLNAKQTIKHLRNSKDSINREYKEESIEIHNQVVSTTLKPRTSTTKPKNKRRVRKFVIHNHDDNIDKKFFRLI